MSTKPGQGMPVRAVTTPNRVAPALPAIRHFQVVGGGAPGALPRKRI